MISPHVGGGFGSKGTAAPERGAGRDRGQGRRARRSRSPTTRQQMFAFTGYRTPTIQRLRLGADADGRAAGDLARGVEQTSTAEGVRRADRDLLALDVRGAEPAHRAPARGARRADAVVDARAGRVPGHVRARVGDGRARASQLGIDPIELRIRNEPDVAPGDRAAVQLAQPRRVPARGRRALRLGAPRPAPGARRDGRWLHGIGVAASTYPAYQMPSQAAVRARRDGGFVVRIAAADIGTGARTVLTQIAADALEVAARAGARSRSATARFPRASVAGGSSGTASWGTAVVLACRALREQLAEHGGEPPEEGLEATADTARVPEVARAARPLRVRRAVRRGARRRRHGRGARLAHARRVRRRAGSSTRAPPARSSSAA